MTDDIVVKQSEESASQYSTEVLGHSFTLTFVSNAKGRMDFSVLHDDRILGKYNLLSQHSITRLVKEAKIADGLKDEMKQGLLQAGEILRTGTFVPAEIEDKKLKEVESLDGQPCSMGVINSDTKRQFLGSPDLLDRISDILHHSRPTPFVGDEANLLLTFLVMLSAKTTNALNLEMIGTSSAGKTYLTLTARNGLPRSMCVVLAGASREALKYDYDEIAEDGSYLVHVNGKCIIILEKDESEAFMRRMKPLMSGDDDELVFKTPIKNEMTGEIETRDFKIIGKPSFITLTTRNPSEEEQITRQLLMTPDTSVDKIQAVVHGALDSRARPEDLSIHEDLQLLQASMLMLNQYSVRNIWAPLMREFFPANAASHQRDITKVLSIIDTIATLHQKQRPTETINGKPYVVASIEDNIIGLILADLVLRASLSGVPDDSWMVFLQLNQMEEAKRSLTEDNILQWLHIHAFHCSKNALRDKHLSTLVDAGLIEISKRGGGRGGARKTYKIVKSRKGLTDMYSLTPLFIDAISKNLPDIISDFQEVIRNAEPPSEFHSLSKKDASVLRSLGCASKDESKTMRALLIPQYCSGKSKRNVIWGILGSTATRKILFSARPTWLGGSAKIDATEEFERKKEVKEEIKRMSRIADADDDDAWEAILKSHLADFTS